MVELPAWGLIAIGAACFVAGAVLTLVGVLVVTGRPSG
jgi:hypothetical protein